MTTLKHIIPPHKIKNVGFGKIFECPLPIGMAYQEINCLVQVTPGLGSVFMDADFLEKVFVDINGKPVAEYPAGKFILKDEPRENERLYQILLRPCWHTRWPAAPGEEHGSTLASFTFRGLIACTAPIFEAKGVSVIVGVKGKNEMGKLDSRGRPIIQYQ